MKKFTLSLLLLWGIAASPNLTAAEDCTCPCECEPSPTTATYSSKIILNEIMPNPSTSDSDFEFLELKNTDTVDVCLSDWQLSDASGKVYKISSDDYSDTTIKAGGFFTVYTAISKISLNNDGDTVNLLQPDDNLLETITYDKSTEDYTYAKDNTNSWQWTSIPTPNAENQFTESTEKQPAYDLSDNIIINEIYADPLEDEVEFIELKNKGNSEVNLNGWKLADATDKKFIISAETYTDLKINKYFIITGDISKIALNNSGDTVKLYKPDDTLVQTIEYKDGAKGQSYNWKDNKWQWSNKTTPKEDNIIETTNVSNPISPEKTTYQYSNKIIITELLPDPEGADSTDEFIEIYNNDNQNIDLLGWSLQDSSRTFTWEESVIIKPQEYQAFYITDTKISLNNLGEKISLLDPDEKTIAAVTYGKAETGYSYNLENNEWFWSSQITPDAKNIIEEPAANDPGNEDTEYPLLNIQDAREQEKDSKVQIEGVITVLPGTLGSQYFYLQDNTGGLQIYSSQKSFPDNLKIGDLIKVKGKMSEAYDETKLNISTADDIVIEDASQEINIISLDELTEEQEGSLATTQSQILELSSTKINLANGILIYLKAGVSFNKNNFTAGDIIKVTGIVNQYKDEYRLLPRATADIEKIETTASNDNGLIKSAQAEEIGASSTLNSHDNKIVNYLFIIIAGLVSAMLYLLVKTGIAKKYFGYYLNRAAGGEKNTKAKDGPNQYHA